MSVKRYEWVACDEHSCHCDVVESAEGDMVDYEDYAALEQKLAESHREFRAADATIENLQMQVEKLAAENAGLKESRKNLAEFIHEELDAGYPLNMSIETPATDDFLAEVRAQGVEQLASLAGNECQRYKSVNDRAGVRKWKSIVILCTDFAAQLRKGVQP